MTMIIDGTNGGFFPSWTTGTRPASPAVGQMGYNTTTGKFDQYTAAGWTSVGSYSAGQVLQTVFATNNTQQSTSTQGNYLTAVSQSITLSSTSSKLLVIARLAWKININASTASWTSARIQINGVSAAPAPGENYEQGINFGNTSWSDFRGTAVVNSLTSPASTSALTVTGQMAPYSTTTLTLNELGYYYSSLILMEIAG